VSGPPADFSRTLILIPAYDETRAIAVVIAGARRAAPGADVLVVDDGSRDRTSAVARMCGAFVLRHPFNLGHGAALQTGYRWALARGYSFVVQLDADGQHDPRDIPALLGPLAADEADLVLGSRFLSGRTYPISRIRRVAMRFFAALAGWLTGETITDPTTGYQGLGRAAFAFHCGDHFPADFPDADVIVMAHRAGLRLREVPVRMYAPQPGRSMHAGWVKLYYVFKQLVSLSMVVLSTGLRSRPVSSRSEAPEGVLATWPAPPVAQRSTQSV